jgi:predicted nucleotide-binding protein (sugar kinase/HSP70/actin superfamily)
MCEPPTSGANAEIIETQITEPLKKSDQWHCRNQKYQFTEFTGKQQYHGRIRTGHSAGRSRQ